MLAIRLPVEVERRLDALARATGKTKTYFARQAIVEHLDEIEAREHSGDDPFGAFSEWDSAADRRGYRGL
jgi:predicted transcriptional regulator